MDTNKMRDSFEAWAENEVGLNTTASVIPGCYCEPETETAWAAWQASREAVVVELPELRSVPDRDCWARTNGLGFNNALKEARQVIEAHGLKVKP